MSVRIRSGVPLKTKTMTPFNTRIAPSPSGYFHLGTARTAYHNWLVARATGGKFILRIDDTDVNRNDDNCVQAIYDTMDWLGLDYDHTFRQSDRMHRYNMVASKLVDDGKAVVLDNGAIALKAQDMPDSWNDTIAGDIKIGDDDLKLIDGLILIKGDGTPTYNFCSIVDDMASDVNWIIRGVDHIKNTPKQLAVMSAVMGPNLPVIKFTHLGLIHHKVDGKDKKMSKRDGAMGVMDYKAAGYSPDAFLNYILKLGWSMSDPNFDKNYKTISKQQAIDLVMQGHFRAAKSSFDQTKLDSLNNKYLHVARG